MPHDKNGKLLNDGDRVFVPAIVRQVHVGDEYCNVTLETEEAMHPSPSKTTITLNTRQVILQAAAVLLLLLALTLSGSAQTNPPAPPTPSGLTDLGNTVLGYFTSMNPALDSTFGASSFDLWTGVSSVQGGDAPIVNDLGLSYDLFRPAPATNATVRTAISLENVIRDSGLAGNLISDQFGPSFSIIVHDVKLTAYLDGGYNFWSKDPKFANRLFGEVGIRAKKAVSSHFYFGVGLGQQFPTNVRILSAFTGATF